MTMMALSVKIIKISSGKWGKTYISHLGWNSIEWRAQPRSHRGSQEQKAPGAPRNLSEVPPKHLFCLPSNGALLVSQLVSKFCVCPTCIRNLLVVIPESSRVERLSGLQMDKGLRRVLSLCLKASQRGQELPDLPGPEVTGRTQTLMMQHLSRRCQ